MYRRETMAVNGPHSACGPFEREGACAATAQ